MVYPISQRFHFHKMIVPLVCAFATSKIMLTLVSVKRTEKNNPFLQVPSDTKPTLHLVCAVRPQPAAQLGARPKVCYSHLLFILGFCHVVRFSATCKKRHSVHL